MPKTPDPIRIFIEPDVDYHGDRCDECGEPAEKHEWVDMMPYPDWSIVHCSIREKEACQSLNN